MKKIVIVTSFAEFHLLELLIPNIIETINPDQIFIVEGRMKLGPENKGFENEIEFNKKWTYNGEGITGFDWENTKGLEVKYPYLVKVIAMNYNRDLSATDCYIHAISSFDELQPEIGDLIYCLESDSFILESDKTIIDDECSRLDVGQGLSVKYVDFLETQFYTELCNIHSPKFRRFVYKFDNWGNYRFRMGSGFVTQDYTELKKTDSYFLRHYCWWRPNNYKQLRFDLIRRGDPNYWKEFEKGLRNIREMSEQLVEEYRSGGIDKLHPIELLGGIYETIRPSRSDEGRYAQFIEVEHPKAIQSHKNWVK